MHIYIDGQLIFELQVKTNRFCWKLVLCKNLILFFTIILKNNGDFDQV